MKDLTLLACWAYLIVAVAGLIPFFSYLLRPKGAYFLENAADKITGLSEEGRTRLNEHLNRERITWNYTRDRIDRYQRLQTYVPVVSVVAPILLTLLAAQAKHPRHHLPELQMLVSFHLAVTLGLYKALKVEKITQDSLKVENEFYCLLRSLEDRVGSEPEETLLKEYFDKYKKVRLTAYEGELSGLASPRE
jgi:hypothetical protein